MFLHPYIRLPPKTFSLGGFKEAFAIMERYFCDQTSEDDEPALTLEFTNSTLMTQFRKTNNLLTTQFRGLETNLKGIFSTLLNNSPPNSDALQEEGSGVGQIKVFLAQTQAEFQSAKGHPGDVNTLAGLETNLLRVASDYFWASHICGFLSEDGLLSEDSKILLEASLGEMIERKTVTIPDDILQPLFRFLRYTQLGARHLNKFSAGVSNDNPVLEPLPVASNKRKRLILRLGEGHTRAKKRRFPFSRVKEAVRAESLQIVEDQVRILESHAIVECPSKRSVQLVRSFSDRAQAYMVESCGLTYVEIAQLEVDAADLRD